MQNIELFTRIKRGASKNVLPKFGVFSSILKLKKFTISILCQLNYDPVSYDANLRFYIFQIRASTLAAKQRRFEAIQRATTAADICMMTQ